MLVLKEFIFAQKEHSKHNYLTYFYYFWSWTCNSAIEILWSFL